MNKTLRYKVRPEIAFDDEKLNAFLSKKISLDSKKETRLTKRSIDARGTSVMVNIELEVVEQGSQQISYTKPDNDVADAEQVVIVGAGPAGLFAAMKCIELGVKPIIVERGKDVQARRKDIANINKEHIVNPDSNYCFGEGGAGTYSDGKLYTRSKKRGNMNRVLEIFVAHGAKTDILIDAHPHIGTNKLPEVIKEIRETILSRGGEILFDSKVEDFILERGDLKGVKLANGDQVLGLGVILATGHSARDIYELLDRKHIAIEVKAFALGVRIEHPQPLIDKIQYHCDSRGEYLPAAPYSLATQIELNKQTRGVFSFCMCPGGFIVPSATNPGEVVTNGMSPSKRDSKFANSGMVVAIENEDLKDYAKYGSLAGMQFQKEIEQKACVVAGGTQAAPAQKMVDFLQGRVSKTLQDCSYQPGLVSSDLSEVLPKHISDRLKKGFTYFGRKMKGYLTNEALVVGVESRTSSPVKIPRDKETLEHIEVNKLYPCAEGAGYAGGIMSAAIDGENCAEMLVKKYAKAKK
jgi:uncharacterized FAD-dependent dehydrogenase